MEGCSTYTKLAGFYGPVVDNEMRTSFPPSDTRLWMKIPLDHHPPCYGSAITYRLFTTLSIENPSFRHQLTQYEKTRHIWSRPPWWRCAHFSNMENNDCLVPTRNGSSAGTGRSEKLNAIPSTLGITWDTWTASIRIPRSVTQRSSTNLEPDANKTLTRISFFVAQILLELMGGWIAEDSCQS